MELEQVQAPEALVELVLKAEEELVQALEALVERALEALVEPVLELEGFRDFQELGGSQDLDAGEDPQVMEVGDVPQVREALGGLDQLLSCCVRRLDTMVQVGTGWALLGR